MRKLFGTDGIRGTANIYPMDASTAYKVGVSIGYSLNTGDKKPDVVIGRDTRLSGSMIERFLIAGLCASGCTPMPAGVISTPGVAHLTRQMDAEAGIVISASHNPFIDNGIKIFSSTGYKLPDAVELEIEKLILDAKLEDLHVAPHRVGSTVILEKGYEKYIEALVESMGDNNLAGMNIVFDCANGASYKVAPVLFEKLGAKVNAIGINPDGKNINQACGSLHPEKLQEMVLEKKADLGVAFDGDADRAIFVDANGEVVDGDHIMAICANRLAERGKLSQNTLVATVMSNIGLDIAMEKKGIKVVKTAVGDRYVVEEMRKKGYNFGGEQSGHLIFLDHSTTGDGLLTAVQVAGIMNESGSALSDLSAIMTRYPQVLKNLRVGYKQPLNELKHTTEVIEKIEKVLGNAGRVLVRYSGTENKVRVMVEGKDQSVISEYVDEIIQSLDSELN